MANAVGAELWPALSASPEPVSALRRSLKLPPAALDIYLTYASDGGSRFTGYLVTGKDDINQVIAHCPIPPDLEIGSALWRREVWRQFQAALRVASTPGSSLRSADVIWLRNLVDAGNQVPIWIFALACVPITREWNGLFQFPCPFCPRLFETLARQPEAASWLLRHADGLWGSRQPCQSSN